MDRKEKGRGIRNCVKDYCVVDLETTGIFVRSAKIIEISAIKVRDNQVVEEYSTLINPGCHIPADATAINGITDEMVLDAPRLDEIIDPFIEFVGNDVIVGYNNAGFDMNLLYDAINHICGKSFTNNYLDILHSVRRCLTELNNYRLETVSKFFSLDTTGEHRALKDCYLTKAVYDRLYQEFGDKIFAQKERINQYAVHFSAETLALQELQTLLEVIIKDGQVTFEEFYALKKWMEMHRDLQGNFPFDRVFNALDKVLEDGIVVPEELDELQILFSDFVDPVKNISCHDEITSIKGMHIVVTGDFNYGSRNKVFSLIEAAGGINDNGVKKATNYVVVGAKGSESWKTGKYGGKIQKALELKDKGSNIEIIEECEFIPVVQDIIENMETVEENNETKRINEDSWQTEVRDTLNAIIKEYGLPAGSLYLSDNYGQTEKTKNTIISHTVCIWEPDYPPTSNDKPTQNKLVVTIVPSKVKSRPDDLDLNIRRQIERDLRSFIPGEAEILSQTQSDKSADIVRIRISKESPDLCNYIRQIVIYSIGEYESKVSAFGCCGLFEKCSDAKECIHENKLYSKACAYRKNLEQGKIFYGKNRNCE